MSCRPSNGPRSPSWGTTRRTPRCCWRRSGASRRGRSPSGCASGSGGELGASADRIEVAGPGFLNVFLTGPWYRSAVAAILEAGERFGAGLLEPPERVLVEFVSANPTGPLTAASGRGAAFGDSLARTLELAGNRVEREYYINDTGGQVERFAESIAARMRGSEPPEDGYAGEYVTELAAELAAAGADPDDLDDLARRGTEAMRVRIAASLDRFGVRFDGWFSERSLHEAPA